MVWVQASRSTASMTAVSQAALIAKAAGGEAAQAGVLAAADAVLDPGVGAVAGVEERQLPDAGVGGDALVAPAVAFLEGVELRAGVRAFPADEDPGAGRVVGQRRRPAAGRSARPRAAPSRCSAVGVDGVGPGPGRQRGDGVAFPVGDRPADREWVCCVRRARAIAVDPG